MEFWERIFVALIPTAPSVAECATLVDECVVLWEQRQICEPAGPPSYEQNLDTAARAVSDYQECTTCSDKPPGVPCDQCKEEARIVVEAFLKARG